MTALKFMLCVGSVMLAGAAAWAQDSAAISSETADLIARGQYVATASDCTACHTSNPSEPYAGNHVITSPVGDIVATNITPSKTAGIGNYTEAQFSDAVRHGIRADGARLYPAMPYTAFAKITDADMKALYAYFMNDVKPVDTPSKKTQLPFPFNIRASMIGWNLLFADADTYQTDTSKSDQWNRGAYLVQGPAHCSTCHTPRGVMMQEKSGDYLGGAQVGPWYAPNITSDPQSGIGSWSKDEIVSYLGTGRAEGKAQAGGSMAEAVEHSFSHLQKSDLEAIATYLANVPAKSGPSRFDQGSATNLTTEFCGIDGAPSGLAVGAQIYSANCATCHGINGQGTKDQYYPSLYHNSATSGPSASNFIATVLNGIDRKTPQGHVFMPPFGTQDNAFNALSDSEIAQLANYVSSSFGDGGFEVSSDEVVQIRAGGPSSNLLSQVRIAMVIGLVIALIIIAIIWVVYRARRQRSS
ncbi:cytochrome c (plasmid) [Thioclava sp. 'Guangxiensis']|uniref:cytochrome c n=1 Tax=Thioclava sp. 'Guangxiensis' TaxID=3149044 RepID=UPI0032C3E2C8